MERGFYAPGLSGVIKEYAHHPITVMPSLPFTFFNFILAYI
jgi:hypothetical protein